MKINPKSLHYRLASVYGRGEYDIFDKTDLCSYLWRVFMGTFIALVAVFMGTMLTYLFFLDVIVWVVLCIAEGRLMPMLPQTIVILGFWSFAITLVAVIFYKEFREEEGKEFMPVPGIVKEAYRGWKERYCAVVEFRAD